MSFFRLFILIRVGYFLTSPDDNSFFMEFTTEKPLSSITTSDINDFVRNNKVTQRPTSFSAKGGYKAFFESRV